MNIKIICGTCGMECSGGFNHNQELIVTCHNCQNTLKRDEQTIGDLEDDIFELGRKVKNVPA